MNGDPWSSWADRFDTDLVVGLREGPPQDASDLDAAQGLTRLVFFAFATRYAQPDGMSQLALLPQVTACHDAVVVL
ncbi:hypothetical protein ABT173_04530 [Streptomyces sp. NPDC001795]|uniref:hypothetical protein n=1 Tax=Streptomyces sp. NPDC001795 TaxID=3154525 RepID=UPI0033174171